MKRIKKFFAGPVGPVGAHGIQGPAGPKGDKGEPGEDVPVFKYAVLAGVTLANTGYIIFDIIKGAV